MRSALALLLLLVTSPAWADVAFDDVGSVARVSNGTSMSITDLSLTGSNGAVAVGVTCSVNMTGMAVTIGGSAASQITNANNANTHVWGLQTGSTSGAVTVALSWTTSQLCSAVAIGATGVDQTTPFDGGQTTINANGQITITSGVGDLTFSFSGDSTTLTTNQTERAEAGTGIYLAGDTGSNNGNILHDWETSPWGTGGANFNAAAVATDIQMGTGMSSGGFMD